MKTLLHLLVPICLLCLPNVADAQTTSAVGTASPDTLSILGQGEYDAKPEKVELTGKVVTEGQSVASARDAHPAVVAKVRSVIDGLAAQGLKLDSATYKIEEIRPSQDEETTANVSTKTVYDATTTFRLSTENLDKIADLVSALAASDLQLDTINFTVKNSRAPLIEARKAAASDALEQADAYATALGITLAEIKSVRDGDATPPDGEADLTAGLHRSRRSPLSIVIPDTLPYTASVNIDWVIKPKTQ